ncbi:MAG: UvrD-helicase domain-containing protein [Marinilabiliaceae bacterium]
MQNISFINAGAGSGKTYTLIQTLSQDISANRYSADEVLLTTFTRKAAEEIKLKARTRLLQDGLSEQAFKLDSAFMGTVHSVGYQFLNKYWYLVGLSPNIREMPEEDVESYFRNAIANIPSIQDMDALNHFNRKFDFQAGGIHAVSDPFMWQKHVKEIVDMAITNRVSDLSPKGESYKASVDWFKTIFNSDHPGNPDLSEDVVRRKILSITQKVLALPDKNNKRRKGKAKDIKSAVLFAVSFNDLLKAVELAVDVADKTPLGDDPEVNGFVNEYAGFYTSPAFQKEVEGYIRLIFKLAANSLKEFEDFKKSHGLVDFNDMEIMFLELLTMKQVREEIAGLVKVVMVDEFQDSNPVQLAIFLTLSDIVEESIWVGDPKQAIYGFRGTDPELVNGLFKKIALYDTQSNLKARLLKRSWRSRAGLVKLVNNLFEGALEPQLAPVNIFKDDVLGFDPQGTESDLSRWVARTFKDNNQMTLSPRQTVALIPVRDDREEGLIDAAPIHWHFGNSSGRGGGKAEDWVNYMSGALKDWLETAPLIVDKEDGKKRRVRPGDVAVLCRSNAWVVKVSRQLRDLGLEVSAETEGLNDTVEYRILLNILKLLIDPYDSLAVSELMLLFPSGDGGKTVVQLLNERLDFLKNAPSKEENSRDWWVYMKKWGADYPVFARIDHIRHTGMHLSVKELVHKVISDTDMYGHLAAFGDAEQRRANLQNIIHYADQFNDHCTRMNKGESISGFVDYLGASENLNKQAASNSDNAINVLTWHKSKGLEWPVVLLFELTADYRSNFYSKHLFKTTINSKAETPVETPLKERFIRFGFWPFGAKTTLGEHDNVIEETDFYKETERKIRDEELRLLYVGMTRARDYLITTSFNNKESKWLKMMLPKGPEAICQSLPEGDRSMDLFDCGVDVAVTKQFFDYDGPAYDAEKDANEDAGTWFEKDGPQPQDSPLYLSPSKIATTAEVQVDVVKKLDYRIRVSGGMKNNTLGELMHNALFLMDRKSLNTGIQNLIVRNGAELNLEPDELSSMVAEVKNFIAGFGPLKIHRELFMVKTREDGQVLRGEADLVLERESDLILIDYKTYQGGEDQFLDTGSAFFAGKYAGQLNAYQEMAENTLKKPVSRKLIFYVMQGTVVEIGDEVIG